MNEEVNEAQAMETTDAPLSIPVHVGTMGWGYADWSGPFYPADAASRDYIALYARVFDTVEIDSTFYATPRESQVKQWRKVTPEHFRFCPKVPRAITHDLRLVNVEEPLTEFVRVMGLLGPKRGPMLLQMPPDFTRSEIDSLRAFVPTLHFPDDPTARFAIEFRHRSLIGPDVSALLAEHQVALAVTDYVAMPKRFEVTTDFLYLRLIGRHGAYPQHREPQADRTPELQRWAETLRAHQEGLKSAFVFCNNDYEGFSPHTAEVFKHLLGLPTAPRPQAIQGSLF